ncbi:MAG: DUF1302 domain-containing protein [Panacagrimonas sp.]
MNACALVQRFACGAVLTASYCATAMATEFPIGPATLKVDGRASLGLSWRIEDRDPNKVGMANGGNAFSTNNDDGNLGFDQGELVASALKLTSFASLEWRDVGVFVRGSYLFDPTLDDHDFFDRADYGVGKEAPLSERKFKQDEVQGHVGHDGDILDAYLFGSGKLRERSYSWKIGKQKLEWGETNFIPNGLNSIGAADISQLRVPGFEFDEVFTPLSMAWASIELPYRMNLEGFYQLDWQQTEPDVAGGYRSNSDFVGIGGTRANLGFGRANENTPGTSVIRGPDNEPEDAGQYGGALRVFLPGFNDTDLAFYAANYHSRLPVFSGTSAVAPQTTVGANYFIEYPEDIQLYGLSFNTAGPVGLALQGEYSYKVDQPLQIDDVELLLAGLGVPSQVNRQLGGASGQQYIRGWRRHDVSQLNLSITRLFGPSSWLRNDQLLFGLEAAGMYVHDLPDSDRLRYEGPGTFTPGFDPATDGPFRAALLASQNLPAQDGGYATQFSWGYKLFLRGEYNNVFGRYKLNPQLRFEHDVSGVSPAPIINFYRQRKLAVPSLIVSFGEAWTGEVGFTVHFDGGARNQISDRDTVDFNLKYFF